jgi:hypothetical protein
MTESIKTLRPARYNIRLSLQKTIKLLILAAWLICSGTLTSCLKNPQSTEPISVATYQMIFRSTWSAQTHPVNFPTNAHYSPIFGISHDKDFTLWQIGQPASPGMENMAELGDNSLLVTEVNVSSVKNRIGSVFFGKRFDSPGSDSVVFTIAAAHPLVSFVCMLAPSPDWFTGITQIPLRNGQQWVDSLTVDLYVYDAGTDAGSSYRSPDVDIKPGNPILLLTSTENDFQNGRPSVGYVKFIRID